MVYQNTNWNHLYAEYRGGYIYGIGKIHNTFGVKCKLGNITSFTDPGNVGPDSGSAGDNIVDCAVECSQGTLTEADIDPRLAVAVNRFSMYKYINKKVTSRNNKFKNCIGKRGAIFYLENSEFSDYGSTYEGNGAV
jgi:hypothetical protein